MLIKKPKTFLLTLFILGWTFDFLFAKTIPGISFFIFVLFVVMAGLILSKMERKTPATNSIHLLIPIFYFSIMSFIRAEPLTTFLNYLATILLLGIFSHTFLGGKWPFYKLTDHITAAFSLGIDALSRQVILFNQQLKSSDLDDGKLSNKKKAWSYVRALALTIPIIIFFANLLTSADPIFANKFDQFFKIFQIENLSEYAFRSFLVFLIAYLLGGIYLHAFYKNHDAGLNNKRINTFLGFTETSTILGSVNILFLSFVVIQIQYFFGGKTNVAIEGFTYAEYAQRGFAELVTVAVFSLILFLGLSAIAKKETNKQQTIFSGLGISLFLLIGVILASALQRILLYEQAYGFTRLRTYTHVFIIWLGLLLAIVIIFEITKYQKFFTFAALLASIGFIISLNMINVDTFIAKKNIDRFENGQLLDIAYLASLSEDMLPTISKLYSTTNTNKEELAGVITCHAAINNFYDQVYDWRSFHFSRNWASDNWTQRLEGQNADDFTNILINSDTDYFPFVFINGEEVSCWDLSY